MKKPLAWGLVGTVVGGTLSYFTTLNSNEAKIEAAQPGSQVELKDPIHQGYVGSGLGALIGAIVGFSLSSSSSCSGASRKHAEHYSSSLSSSSSYSGASRKHAEHYSSGGLGWHTGPDDEES